MGVIPGRAAKARESKTMAHLPSPSLSLSSVGRPRWRRLAGDYGSAVSLDRQRHEAHFALGVGDQQQRGFFAVLLDGIEPLGHVGRARDWLLANLDDDLAGLDALVGGVGVRVDARHHD